MAIPQVSLGTAASMMSDYHSLNITPMLLGPSGIGKTSIVESFAAESDLHVETIHGSHYTPMDIMGVGVPVEQRFTRFLMPELFGRLNNAAADGRNTVLFIDEVTHASPTMLALYMQLVLERRVAGHTLPEDCWIVLAGNRRQDRGPVYNMNSILTNRLAVLDVMPPTADEWAMWAIVAGVAPEVVAFLKRNPHELFDFDPDRLVNQTPRQWESCSSVLQGVTGDGIKRSVMMQSLVGPVALKLEAMLKLRRDLPSLKEILADPDNAPVPAANKLAAQHMTAVMISQNMTALNAKSLARYVLRLPLDMQVLTIKSVVARDAGISAVLVAAPGMGALWDEIARIS